MNRRSFVIVGAGLAGGTAAATLRAEGFDGRILIVGEEGHAPYSRPPLSKQVLRAEQPPEKAFLRPPEWYAEHEIELRLGVRAIAVDPRSRTIELSDSDAIGYDGLLLTTGGRPRTLDVPGADLAGVLTLRTLDDAVALRDLLGPDVPVVVVGAGFIGAEVAASARTVGCRVTIIEILDVPLARVLGTEIGRIYAEIHRERGVDLRTRVGLERIEGDGSVRRVVATDGCSYDAAVVVIGVGISPDVELASRSGLEVGNGVIVDEYCETSVSGVYAAGDIANHPNSPLGRRIRVEHWQNAQHQGAAAAGNMLGRRRAFGEVPWFWSDQYEHNLQMAGYPDPSDRIVIRGDVDGRNFSAFFLRDGLLTGALGVNRPLEVRAARRMIQEGTRPDERALADEGTDLLELAEQPS